MSEQKSSLSYIEGGVSIIFNLALFGLKFWAGTVTGSVAIIADAWHTLTDSVSSLIVLIGVKISQKPADEDHPFGHGRAELIASILIGVLLLIIAWSFAEKSVEALKNNESVVFGTIALVVIIISIVVKEGLAQFAFWAARKTGSPILKADGWHHRSDAISSIIILVGIFLNPYFWWIDGVLGIIVSLLIAYSAYEIIKESALPLLGKKPESDLMKKITSIIAKTHEEPISAHHFHIHDYGNHAELTFHINLPSEITLYEAHTKATQIEKAIKEELNIDSTIHMEPIDSQI